MIFFLGGGGGGGGNETPFRFNELINQISTKIAWRHFNFWLLANIEQHIFLKQIFGAIQICREFQQI